MVATNNHGTNVRRPAQAIVFQRVACIALLWGATALFAPAAYAAVEAVRSMALTCVPNQAYYQPGDGVVMRLHVTNAGNVDVVPLRLRLRMLDVKNRLKTSQDMPCDGKPIKAHASIACETSRWTLPLDAGAEAIFVSVTLETTTGNAEFPDACFIRTFASSAKPLMVYSIRQTSYQGIQIFCLDGGMSAEFTVEKALESLACGISHSWYTSSPGSGPRPVYASSAFMQRSLDATIQYYDQLGAETTYGTVIISTGVACVPYLARVMKAPVLPAHFLVSFSSFRELRGLLKTASAAGISAYAVGGYDPSVRDEGVAWIKLLDVPPAYLDFIKRHHVRNVVLVGSDGKIGETLARRLKSDQPGGESPSSGGEIYLLYRLASYLSYSAHQPAAVIMASRQYQDDVEHLKARVVDVETTALDDAFLRIDDWESGLSQEQRQVMSSTLSQRAGIQSMLSISALEDGNAIQHLYAYATRLMLAFYKKNTAVMGSGATPMVKGIMLNPYLTSHPFYESKMQYVPYLFWQGSNVNDLLRDLCGPFYKTVLATCPNTRTLNVYLNVAKNFNLFGCTPAILAERLRQQKTFPVGTIEIADDTTDEVWDPGDPRQSSTEAMADELAETWSSQSLKQWDAQLQPLSLDDLRGMTNGDKTIIVRDLGRSRGR